MKTIACPKCQGTGKLPEPKSLGMRLRKMRVKAGLTVVQVARLLAVTTEYVYMVETGARKPSPEFYANLLGVCGRPKPNKSEDTYAKAK